MPAQGKRLCKHIRNHAIVVRFSWNGAEFARIHRTPSEVRKNGLIDTTVSSRRYKHMQVGSDGREHAIDRVITNIEGGIDGEVATTTDQLPPHFGQLARRNVVLLVFIQSM